MQKRLRPHLSEDPPSRRWRFGAAGHGDPSEGVSVSSRRGWGPAASQRKSVVDHEPSCLVEISWRTVDKSPKFERIPLASVLPCHRLSVSMIRTPAKEASMRTALGVPLRRPAQVNASHAAARMGIAPVNTTADDKVPLGVPQRAPSPLRYRLPHARKRGRSRRHCAGCLGQVADHRSPRGSRCAGIPGHCHDAGRSTYPVGPPRCETCVGPGCPNRWTPAPTLDWQRNGAKRWSLQSWCCWRNFRPPNGPPTFFVRRSTTHIATSRDPSTRSSQHSPTGDPRPAACRRWPARAREFDRARAPSQGFHRRCPGRQSRRTGTSLCIGYRRQPGWLGGIRRPAGLSVAGPEPTAPARAGKPSGARQLTLG